MIIALADEGGTAQKAILAGALAAARARSGRKVLLLDADPRQGALACCAARAGRSGPVARAISAKGLQPELEHLVRCYHDIVIDTEGRDSLGSRAALIGAQLALLPFDADGADSAGLARLAARIGKARQFNPGLRVLVVRAAGASPERARAFAAQIPAATVSDAAQLYDAVFRRGAMAPAGTPAVHGGGSRR